MNAGKRSIFVVHFSNIYRCGISINIQLNDCPSFKNMRKNTNIYCFIPKFRFVHCFDQCGTLGLMSNVNSTIMMLVTKYFVYPQIANKFICIQFYLSYKKYMFFNPKFRFVHSFVKYGTLGHISNAKSTITHVYYIIYELLRISLVCKCV